MKPTQPTQAQTPSDDTPTTAAGNPDRRFKGHRDDPPPPSQGGVGAQTGGVIDDRHVTADGKPDLRFKENRALSEEEAKQIQGENLIGETNTNQRR